MSNHTKAPTSWQAESENLAYLVESDDATIIARLSADDVSNNFSRVVANTRRIVACVNACEGISTENLEDNKPIIELANDYNAVLKQRDMLLDVLKQIAKVETHGGDISASWTLISVKHLAQGLVEKVKGGAV